MELVGTDEFEHLLVGFERVHNISKKHESDYFDSAKFVQNEEKELFEKYLEIKPVVLDYIKHLNYKDALRKITELRPFIDRYFDKVFVMVEEEDIRLNRLGFLKTIDELFSEFGDLTLIEKAPSLKNLDERSGKYEKLTFIFLIITFVLTYAQGVDVSQLLNASKPSSVVAQPYIIRATLVPGSSEGVYTIGVEGYLDIFGLNLSLGTTVEYPNFELNQPVYVGLGISTSGLFVALSSNVPNFEQISDLSAYETPTVAFGIASYKKTSFLFASWSRFELSFENRGVFKKQDGQFVLNDSLDWLNATVNFKVESCDVGYFLFRFTVPSLKDCSRRFIHLHLGTCIAGEYDLRICWTTG